MTTIAPTKDDPPSAENAPRSGFKNFRSILVGRMVSALSIWLAIVALTKLSDPATVGMYAFAQAICIPIAEVAKMSLREVRSSDTHGFFEFGDYFGLRILATLAGFLLMLATGIVQSGSTAMFLVIIAYALARSAELISDMMYGLFQAHERMEFIGRSLCMLGVLSLLLLIAGYWLTGSLVVAVLGQLAAHLAVLCFYDLPLGVKRARVASDNFLPSWNFSKIYSLALQALPLTFATVLIFIALYLPRIVVEHELGLAGLGLFAAILALAMAPDRLVNAMGIAASVRLARHYASGRYAEFTKLLSALAAGVAVCGTVGVMICVLFGEQILRVVYTDAYAAHYNLLVWLVAAATLRGVANILRYGVVAARRFWWLGAQNAVVAIVAVIGCFVLIPRFGLTGAGATMVLVFGAQLVIVLVALVFALNSAGKTEPRL